MFVGSESLILCHMTDRVALLLWLRHKSTHRDVLIATTHLSFPHLTVDSNNQLYQMKMITSLIDSFIDINKIKSPTSIITGDFNAEYDSLVCNHLLHKGYNCCSKMSPPINNVSDTERIITHRNHLREDVNVDHIFVKSQIHALVNSDNSDDECKHEKNTEGLYMRQTEIIPAGLPHHHWCEDFTVSDHRPVSASILLSKL